ncbi:winged helix-turn-helix transcriptional regulator [Nocardia otitidiscaviarum]|uniref:Helix-turn-helix transcriptional regulator n=1 Tax=Nocardia otitidiscaviarum TaxID=1823 RepID=A0A516NK97_9NOCA|nr:helix-turn-helix domain-containing protein [Nocardia otitidiscaviarum]MBF6180379.1 helix-turn-helix transcriptional regulator [Nocardia otitidiscaviarum]MCP9624794.1 helix-turn-helix transcriptional regulator [Nocardia otitidiscaviarum]QDP79322.1 helix-turn-helix transcriptional regulator [Nocardia otitidiscaviarum]
MSGTHTGVPSVLAHELPRPVPQVEVDACPVTEVFRRLGDRWSMLVIVLLGGRAHRYNELHRAIEGISQRMLTRVLRTLESEGLVHRKVYPTVPPSVEYSLTELGTSLLPPISALADWAVANADKLGR